MIGTPSYPRSNYADGIVSIMTGLDGDRLKIRDGPGVGIVIRGVDPVQTAT